MLDSFIYFVGAVSLIAGVGIITFILTLVLILLSVAGLITLLSYISARRRGMKRKDYYATPWRVFQSCIQIYDPFSKHGIVHIWDDIKDNLKRIRNPIPFISKEDDMARKNNRYAIIRKNEND